MAEHPARGLPRRLFALVALILGVGGALNAAMVAPASAAKVDPRAWTVYHHDLAGTGAVSSVPRVDTSSPAWTSPRLDGQIYGEPLAASGRIFVATENDNVYALSAATGKVIWSRHVGTPVPSQSLPCGNISPRVGITGTPVIDQARSELFLVADELVNGSPAHRLLGLNTGSGQIETSLGVDPPGGDPPALLQRTGLTLYNNRVIFGFGGNFGDCAIYRGAVVSVSESGGTPVRFTVDSGAGETQGAVWMGGAAPAIDAHGNIWVGVGNGSVTSSGDSYDDSDSVLELSPSLHLLQYFAPRDWASNNATDLDLSTEPAVLGDGQVVEGGKTRLAYLLNANHLGGIGGEETELSVCSDDVDGGPAVVGTTVYLPCVSGTVAVKVDASPPSLHTVWSSGTGGGPPIVVAHRVWTIGQSGTLYGLSATTGAVKQQASIGVPANHFPTPSVADGLLLAASTDHVVAFTASGIKLPATTRTTTATSSTTAPTATQASPSSRSRPRPGGGLSSAAIIAIVLGAAIVIGAAVWLLRRRGANPNRPAGG